MAFDPLLVEADDGELQPGQLDRGTLSILSGQQIRMRFSLGTLEPGARFRYRMPPLLEEFGDWADRDLAVRGLNPGEFQLEVEGQLPSGRAIEPLRAAGLSLAGAALVRAGVAWPGADILSLWLVAGLLWVGAYGLFAWHMAPLFLAARTDGLHGCKGTAIP